MPSPLAPHISGVAALPFSCLAHLPGLFELMLLGLTIAPASSADRDVLSKIKLPSPPSPGA